jgi:response regulator RpfG family c-di-GMP phosphodiesterase
MKQESGTHFDPECLEAFLGSLDAILAVRKDFRDDKTPRPER